MDLPEAQGLARNTGFHLETSGHHNLLGTLETSRHTWVLQGYLDHPGHWALPETQVNGMSKTTRNTEIHHGH